MKGKTRKLALVTGASSGIGLELARQLAQEHGHDLIIVSASDKIQAAKAQLQGHGTEVTAVVADLSTPEGVDFLVSKIKRPLDMAVLNAGVGVGGAFLDTDFGKELEMMNLNIVHLVNLCKKVVTGMVARNDGKILITSSIAGEMPGPYYAVYAASKAFVQSFTEALRFEIKEAGHAITITSLQPGATDTDFFRRADMLATKAGKGSKDAPEDVARDGLKALMAGKDHVVAGSLMNTVQATAAKFLSDPQGAWAQASSTRPEGQALH